MISKRIWLWARMGTPRLHSHNMGPWLSLQQIFRHFSHLPFCVQGQKAVLEMGFKICMGLREF